MTQCELTTLRTSETSKRYISRTRNFVMMNLMQGICVANDRGKTSEWFCAFVESHSAHIVAVS